MASSTSYLIDAEWLDVLNIPSTHSTPESFVDTPQSDFSGDSPLLPFLSSPQQHYDSNNPISYPNTTSNTVTEADLNNINFYNTVDINNLHNSNNDTNTIYHDNLASGVINSTLDGYTGVVRELLQQLQTGHLTQKIKDPFTPEFVDSMFQLLQFLSMQDKLPVTVTTQHPPIRELTNEQRQFYLGEYKGKKGIKKNERNYFQKGGKHEFYRVPGRPYKLDYVYDSPPDDFKHIILWEFSLTADEGADGESGDNKAKKRKTETMGLLHNELRIFLTAPTRSKAKRKLGEVEKNNQQALQQPTESQRFGNIQVQNTATITNLLVTQSSNLSDETTKKDITSVDTHDALGQVNKMRPCNYVYKAEFGDPSIKNRGILAQDLQKINPDAVRQIDNEGSKLHGKLVVDHNTVLYTAVAGLQELSGEVLVADKFAPILRKAASSLPRSSSCSLPPAEKLDILQKNQILQSFEKNETPRVNLTTTADLLNKYSRRREKLYAQQMGTKVKEEEVERQDKEEMETVKQMKPPERWKRLETILETVEQKRRLVNESWKIQCRDCDCDLCDLAQFYFYASLGSDEVVYYLVSDEKGKLECIVEKKKKSDDSNIDGILVCSDCGSQIGESVLNRGEGSPKPQLKMTMVKFTNTSNKTAVKFPNANDAYEYFSEAMAVEARIATEADQIAEAQKEEERRIAAFPESIRIFVRQVGSKDPTSLTITCKQNWTVMTLLTDVRKNVREGSCDALFFQEDQLNILEQSKFVNDLLRDKETVFYGNLPQNEVLFTLRKYQQELIKSALSQNRAVVCPTGSGKTAIALEVDRVMRSKSKGDFKTIMVVRDLPLSVQQAAYFQNYTRLRVQLLNSDNKLTQTWNDMLRAHDVIILTAQILVNNLDSGRAQLSMINLLILDEAHNTSKKHPFNNIMRKYYDKTLPDERPRVLGLTASPPAHLDYKRTKEMISEFEKSLDSSIVLVNEYKDELRKDLSIPRTFVYEIVPSRYQSVLLSLINKMMEEIERKIERGRPKDKQKEKEDEGEKREYLRGSIEYDNGCNNEELKFLNGALISLNDDIDPVPFLKTKQEEYESVRRILGGVTIANDLNSQKLERFITELQTYENIPNFRGIVFVAMRLSGDIIKTAIQTRNMPFVKPSFLFGQQGKSGLSMTSKEQQQVIQQFKSGEVNLLIATSVAEEGLDLQSCNVVFRYDSVHSHRSLIQTRGRARQRDSKFIIFYHQNSPSQKAWSVSNTKLKNMLKAVGESDDTSPFISPTEYLLVNGDMIVLRSATQNTRVINKEDKKEREASQQGEDSGDKKDENDDANKEEETSEGNSDQTDDSEGEAEESDEETEEEDEDKVEDDHEDHKEAESDKEDLLDLPRRSIQTPTQPSPIQPTPIPPSSSKPSATQPLPQRPPTHHFSLPTAAAPAQPSPTSKPAPSRPSPSSTPINTNFTTTTSTTSTPSSTPIKSTPLGSPPIPISPPTPSTPSTPSTPTIPITPTTPITTTIPGKTGTMMLNEHLQKIYKRTINEAKPSFMQDTIMSPWTATYTFRGLDGIDKAYSGTASKKMDAQHAAANAAVEHANEWTL